MDGFWVYCSIVLKICLAGDWPGSVSHTHHFSVCQAIAFLTIPRHLIPGNLFGGGCGPTVPILCRRRRIGSLPKHRNDWEQALQTEGPLFGISSNEQKTASTIIGSLKGTEPKVNE